MEKLGSEELVNLVKSVFPGTPLGGDLILIMDVPDRRVPDNEDWKARRQMVLEWADLLKQNIGELAVEEVELFAYQNVGSNNADLPNEAFIWDRKEAPADVDDMWRYGREVSFEKVFGAARMMLAPTEFSTTAPLKVAASQYGFRAATMPGFTADMIPALRIDYEEVQKRVHLIKNRLDPAVSGKITFVVDKKDEYVLDVDLRHRLAHASGGCFPDRGEAGNLPSGETYIVPYEGECGEPSLTTGTLPVQHGEDVVLYEVKANRVVSVSGEGKALEQEEEHLNKEQAYGNIAELGFGVLGDFGLKPIGQILLDEKLGFHIAFGRSDHFGGAVGPADFTEPSAVVHIDRIYIESTQPRVQVKEVTIEDRNGNKTLLLKEDKYTCF